MNLSATLCDFEKRIFLFFCHAVFKFIAHNKMMKITNNVKFFNQHLIKHHLSRSFTQRSNKTMYHYKEFITREEERVTSSSSSFNQKLEKKSFSHSDNNNNNAKAEILTLLVRSLIKEWERNPEFRNWIRTSVKTTSGWIQKQLTSITLKVKQLWIGDSTTTKIEQPIIAALPLHLSEEEQVRQLLGLPLRGVVEDWQVLQLENKEELHYPEVVKKQYYILCQKWHPDHVLTSATEKAQDAIEIEKQTTQNYKVFLYFTKVYTKYRKEHRIKQ
jgi:hypothetical protein